MIKTGAEKAEGRGVRDMSEIKPTTAEIKPTDSCSRCGLRRASRTLEEQGVIIRLCDYCFWGKEPEPTLSSAKDSAD